MRLRSVFATLGIVVALLLVAYLVFRESDTVVRPGIDGMAQQVPISTSALNRTTTTRASIASRSNRSFVHVSVADESGNSLANARVAQVILGSPGERMAQGHYVTTSDARGLAAIPVESDNTWPMDMSISANGYLPHLLRADHVGSYDVRLAKGYSLTISVTDLQGTACPNCAVMVSSSPLPRLRDALRWLDKSVDVGEPTDPRTYVQLLRTNGNGYAIADGLPRGKVFAQTVGIGIFERSYDPLHIVVPDTRTVAIRVDKIYAVALRTPGDKSRNAGLTIYDSSRVAVIIGEQMQLLAEKGRELMGDGICIPVAKNANVSEQQFLQFEFEAAALMEKRGPFKFIGKPRTIDTVADAPVWDLARNVEGESGEVVIVVDNKEQERVMKTMEYGLIDLQLLDGAQPQAYPAVLGLGNNKVAAGKYRATGKRGTLDRYLSVQDVIQVVAGQKVTINVELREPLMPVRIKIVDSAGIECGQSRFTIAVPSKSFSSGGFRTGSNREMIFWIPSGHVMVTAATEDKKGTEEFECRGDWITTPIEVVVIINE